MNQFVFPLIFNVIVIILSFFLLIPSVMLLAGDAVWYERMLAGVVALTIPLDIVTMLVLSLILRNNEVKLAQAILVVPSITVAAIILLLLLGIASA